MFDVLTVFAMADVEHICQFSMNLVIIWVSLFIFLGSCVTVIHSRRLSHELEIYAMLIFWESCNREILSFVFLLSYPIIWVVVLYYVTPSSSMFRKLDKLKTS